MSRLADHLASGLDPVVFARRLGIEPDPWQEDVLRSRAQREIHNASRQSGKSSIAALRATHEALYVPGSLVLVLSPSERQSKELFKRCIVAYRSLGRPIAAESENKLSLELDNGSRIVSLPGQGGTIRGFSAVSLLIIDEAAQVDDDVYLAVLPMLAVSGGRLMLLSTPYGRRGFFYEAWRSPEGWKKVLVPATECPRISSAFLAEARESMGPWWFTQEFECEFMDAQTQAFNTADIQAMFDKELKPWIL